MIRLAHGATNLTVVIAVAGVRQELRVVQEVEVVDGDDMSPRAAQGRDEIRAVQQIKPVREEFGAECQRLQAVMAGRAERGLCEAPGDGRAGFVAFINRECLSEFQPLQGIRHFTYPGRNASLVVCGQTRIKADT